VRDEIPDLMAPEDATEISPKNSPKISPKSSNI